MSDESKKTTHNRDARGKFLPGVSGNPGGRPAIPGEVREAARARGLEAIERLVHWMRSDDPVASIAASKLLLERGYGKNAILLGTEGAASLVTVNIGTGRPIDNAHDAASAYAYLIGNPGADISGLTFAAAEPAQAVPQPVEASAPVQSAAEPMPPDPTARPVDEEQQQLWARLAE